MKKRVITGALLLAFFVPLLLFAGDFVFRVSFAVIAVLAMCEMLRCVATIRHIGLLLPLGLFVATSILFPLKSFASWSLMAMVAIFCCLSAVVFSNRKITFKEVGASVLPVIYIVAGFLAFVLLRERGGALFWLVLIGAWGCDTFAYLAGKFFGKKKLIPDISPNKTVAGAIGGVVSGMVLFPLFIHLTHANVNYFTVMMLGAISAVAAQIGDLIMSAIKREYDVKDFGNIFPGHGGILDRFDSVLLVAPILYLYLSL